MDYNNSPWFEFKKWSYVICNKIILNFYKVSYIYPCYKEELNVVRNVVKVCKRNSLIYMYMYNK